MESGANHPLHPSIGGAQPARKRFARALCESRCLGLRRGLPMERATGRRVRSEGFTATRAFGREEAGEAGGREPIGAALERRG